MILLLLRPFPAEDMVTFLESDNGYSIYSTRSFSYMHTFLKATQSWQVIKKNYLTHTQCNSLLSLWLCFTVHCDPVSLFKPFFLAQGSRLLHANPAAFSAFLSSPQSCFKHPQHLPHLPDSHMHAWWDLWLPSTAAREHPCLVQYCRALWSWSSCSARAVPGCKRNSHTHSRKDFFQELQLRLFLDPGLLAEHVYGSHPGYPWLQLGWGVLTYFCSFMGKATIRTAYRDWCNPVTSGLAHPTKSLTPGSRRAAAWKVLPSSGNLCDAEQRSHAVTASGSLNYVKWS